MVTMMKTETHTISSKGYAPLAVGDPDESDLDCPLAARTRASSLSILSSGRINKFSARFSSRRTRRSRLARDLCDESRSPKRECSPPPTMYQRTMCNSLEFESSNGSYRRTPPSLYQRSMWSSVELESGCSSSSVPAATAGRRLERFVNSWEGVLEESDESGIEDQSFRLRVSVCTGHQKGYSSTYTSCSLILSCMPDSWWYSQLILVCTHPRTRRLG